MADNMVDGAAVDSLIWEYMNNTRPEVARKTRILLKSTPNATHPFVVHPSLDPNLKEKLRTALLTAHKKPKGKELLGKISIDRFVPIDDKAYDSIREVKKWVARRS